MQVRTAAEIKTAVGHRLHVEFRPDELVDDEDPTDRCLVLQITARRYLGDIDTMWCTYSYAAWREESHCALQSLLHQYYGRRR